MGDDPHVGDAVVGASEVTDTVGEFVGHVPHVTLHAEDANVPSELSAPHSPAGFSPTHSHVCDGLNFPAHVGSSTQSPTSIGELDGFGVTGAAVVGVPPPPPPPPLSPASTRAMKSCARA